MEEIDSWRWKHWAVLTDLEFPGLSATRKASDNLAGAIKLETPKVVPADERAEQLLGFRFSANFDF
jgi:hypothetical protein